MSQLVGYCRVSTVEQNLDAQKDALEKAGCDRVFEDKASGAKAVRPGLKAVLEYLREGDTLIVPALDRLARSLANLLEVCKQLSDRGIHLRSLREQLDTSSAVGRFQLQLLGALAEMELALLHERTQAGIAAARARGRVGGRPTKLTGKKLAIARSLARDPKMSVGAICETLQISKSAWYRALPKLLED